MGNQHAKHQVKGRPQRQVHWKAAERPAPPGKPELVAGTETTPDVVTIRWTRPKSDGGSPITGYLVEHRRTGSPHWVRSAPLPVTVPELTLSGLEPGWRYQFRVTAQNVVGLSPPGEISEPLTVTLQRSVITAPKFTEELHDCTALENEMAEFVVHIVGQPPPKISWFKDGFEIFSSRRTRITTDNDKSVLTIHQVALSDEGEIKCTATNKAGHVATKCVVKIEAPPKIRLPRQYEDGLLFELDELIRLKVSIAGRPQPLVFWSHNGESLQTGDRHEIIDTDRSSMLRIGEARRTDRGEYQIRAVNKLGEDSASFLVTVTDKPKPPTQLKVVMSLGKTVTLSWGVPEDDGGCKIGNYIVEYYRIGWNVWLKAATCRQLSTTLADLIEGSEYKFRVKAESPYGVSDPSDETDVIFIPDPKRGLLAPPARGRSQPRDAPIIEPVPPKRRAISSTRAAARELAASPTTKLLAPPTPPKREKLRSPQKSPENSPVVTRRDLSDGISKSIFDRSSLARELSYGAPDMKLKKPEPTPPFTTEPERRSPSPARREKSPSRLNQIFSSMLPKRSPSPSSFPRLNVEPEKLEKPSISAEELQPPPEEEIHTMSSLKGDRMDRLSPNIFQRRSSSPMSLDRRSSSPIPERNRSSSLVDNNHLSPTSRSKSPSPVPIPERKERSPSPSKYSVHSQDDSRRESYQNQDMVHGSSEFMLVILEDQDNPNQEYDIFEDSLIPPPMSLSAPELGSDSPLFTQLKTSASSTELLHERAFARFVKEAEESEKGRNPDQISLGRRASFGRKSHYGHEEKLNLPTIMINSKEGEETPFFEKLSSFQRRLSAGISNMTQQYIWAKRRHSLRNPGDAEEIPNLKNITGEENGEFGKREDLSNHTNQDLYKIQPKIQTEEQESISPKRQSPVKTEHSIEEAEPEKETESEEESEDERHKYDLSPPRFEPVEEETYHPRDMIPTSGSKRDEPFEILTKPSPLPDPNFVPKPILKRSVNKKPSPEKSTRKTLQENDSLPTVAKNQSPSPTSKIRPLTPIPSIPESQMFSAAEAAKKKRMLNRQSSEEETKVVADYYADLVREYGYQKRQTTPIYLNRDELIAAAEKEEKKNSRNISDTYQRTFSPPPPRDPVTNTPSKRNASPAFARRTERTTAIKETPSSSTYKTASLNVSNDSVHATIPKRTASPMPITRRPLIDQNLEVKPKATRSRSTSRTRNSKRILPPPDVQHKINQIVRTPSPRLLSVDPEILQAEAETTIRTNLDYITDLAMFILACWIYLFNNAWFAVPILFVMVYRQIKSELSNMVPAWLTKKKKQ